MSDGPTVVVDNSEKRKQRDLDLFQSFKQSLEECDPATDAPVLEMEENDVLVYAAKMRAKWDTTTAMKICEYFNALNEFKTGEIERAIKAERDARKDGKQTKLEHASEDAWREFFRVQLDNPRRDLFTGKLMVLGDDGIWEPALNYLDKLKAEAHFLAQKKVNLFAQDQIKPQLRRFEMEQKRQLCFSIPPWDGVDRIKRLSDSLIVTGEGGVAAEHVEEFIKDWCAKMFARITNPMVRNRVLILKGPQNIGKDWWIDALVGGFGQWASDLTISRHDKDAYLQLSKAAVLKIAEFDRTATWEAATLKDMVTRPAADIRASYDADSKVRYARCSFISSCNVDDILRDHTGSTRFIILEIQKIDFGYPRSAEDKAQILAQCQWLAEQNYRASGISESLMQKYLDARTPGDLTQELIELWHHTCAEWLETAGIGESQTARERGWIEARLADSLIEKIAKTSGFTIKQVKLRLSNAGLGRRNMTKRGWYSTAFARIDSLNLSGELDF